MIKIESKNNSKLKNEIEVKLGNFNKSQRDWFKNKAYQVQNKNFYAFDDDKLIGGAIGYIKYNWYYLDLLFIEEIYRKNGIGSKLLKQIEDFAKKENLTGVRLETWDFQAKGFYEKNGYKVFGEIKNCPPEITEYHLKKEF